MFDTAASVIHSWKIYIVQNKCCIALFFPLKWMLKVVWNVFEYQLICCM